MVSREAIEQAITAYSAQNLTLSTVGSHSALEVARGAKQEGLRNLIVCQKGRDLVYSKYYLAKKDAAGVEHGAVDEVTILASFSEVVAPDVQKQLMFKNCLFVPNRSFCVYVPYSAIENDFNVPVFGNRYLLKAEERDAERNQYYLMEKAGIRTPKRYRRPEDIDALCIVKAPEAQRKYERAFFLARDYTDYEQKSREYLQKGIISKEGLQNSVIEEFVLGAQFNFNFFYSPLLSEVQLMGIDTRRQTNLDGLLRLPAPEQAEALRHVRANNIEVGHIATTVRESLLEKAFVAADSLVEACKKEYPPGIIGPFALQGCIVSEAGREDFVVFDLSLRIPGSPGITATPYSFYYYGQRISMGRRIAMEVKAALAAGRLKDVVT